MNPHRSSKPAEPLHIALLGDADSIHVQRTARWLREHGHAASIIAEDKGVHVDLGGIPLYTYPARGGTAWKLLRIAAHLRRIQPDIVQSDFVTTAGARIAALGFHPHVTRVCGSDVLLHPQYSRKARAAARLTLRTADRILVATDSLRPVIGELAGPHLPVTQLPRGIDLDRFSPEADGAVFRKRHDIPGDALVVLSPRTVGPLYNQDILLEAWPRIRAESPSARLVLIRFRPDATYEAECRRRIEQLGIADSVHWVEPPAEHQLAEAYSAADVMVSIPSSDAIANTVLEAMACECPVVVGDLPAMRDWVSEPDNGRIVPLRDGDAVASAVLSLLQLSAQDRRNLGLRNREVVAERASLATCFERLVALYREESKAGGFRPLSNLARALRGKAP